MSNVKATGYPTLSCTFSSQIPIDAMRAETEIEIKHAITQISGFTAEKYFEKASETLNTTLLTFMQGIKIQTQEEGIDVTIKGWLPTALEFGYEPFDMKPGLLNGRLFRIIPMHDGEFRTMHINSPRNSWWHPGFQAKNISEQVRVEVEPFAEEQFQKIMDRIVV